MGIILDEPKYPVIDSAPSVPKTVTNFAFSDYRAITLFTAAALPFGYIAGKSFLSQPQDAKRTSINARVLRA